MPQLLMAKSLGQAARLKREAPPTIGDRPISYPELRDALERWLPNPSDSISVERSCILAANELQLTPYRFERAMEAMWASHPEVPFEPRTGGTAPAGLTEDVVQMSDSGYWFRAVGPNVLSFGRNGTTRVIARSG